MNINLYEIRNLDDYFGQRNQIRAAEKFLELAKPDKNDKILEIGSGTGFIYEYLIFKGYDVIGLEIDFNQVKVKNKKKFIIANALFLPFKNNTFKFIFLNDVVHHIKNINDLLQEIKRVSENIIIIEPNILNPYSFLFGFKRDEKLRFRNLKKCLLENKYKINNIDYFLFLPANLLIKLEKFLEKTFLKIFGGKKIICARTKK